MAQAAMSQYFPQREFIRLFAQHERTIYAHILALLGDAEATQDVFQETCVVLWEKFAEFQTGTHFGAWARKIAYHKVLKYRQSRARQLPLLSPEFLESVAAAHDAQAEQLSDRLRALPGCVEKLTESDRELLACRYGENRTARDVARLLGRPENTVYKALVRIRRRLLECIERTLAREAHAAG